MVAELVLIFQSDDTYDMSTEQEVLEIKRRHLGLAEEKHRRPNCNGDTQNKRIKIKWLQARLPLTQS